MLYFVHQPDFLNQALTLGMRNLNDGSNQLPPPFLYPGSLANLSGSISSLIHINGTRPFSSNLLQSGPQAISDLERTINMLLQQQLGATSRLTQLQERLNELPQNESISLLNMFLSRK